MSGCRRCKHIFILILLMSEPSLHDDNFSCDLGADDEACSNVLTGTDEAVPKTCSEYHKLEALMTLSLNIFSTALCLA